jgi:hypothetical protein
VDDYLTSLHLE